GRPDPRRGEGLLRLRGPAAYRRRRRGVRRQPRRRGQERRDRQLCRLPRPHPVGRAVRPRVHRGARNGHARDLVPARVAAGAHRVGEARLPRERRGGTGRGRRQAFDDRPQGLPRLRARTVQPAAHGRGVRARLLGSRPDGLIARYRVMATTKQKTTARKNIKKASTTARKKRTISKLPKSTRTALGKQANKVKKQKSGSR